MKAEMKVAGKGDRVTVHYIGTLDNGRIFDQADEENPLAFTLGADEIFTGLENEIVGMGAGEVKNINLPMTAAYGERKVENMLRLSRDQFPVERELRIGEKLSIEIAKGTERVMRIREVNDDTVLLDGNHDLAGCDLTFALKLVSIG